MSTLNGYALSFIVIRTCALFIHFDGYRFSADGTYPPPKPLAPLFSFLGTLSVAGGGPPRDENPVFDTYSFGAAPPLLPGLPPFDEGLRPFSLGCLRVGT